MLAGRLGSDWASSDAKRCSFDFHRLKKSRDKSEERRVV